MRILLLFWCFCSLEAIAQNFKPIPPDSNYSFDLQKNFFKDEQAYREQFNAVVSSLDDVNSLLRRHPQTASEWISVFDKYNKSEAAYRQVDLYLFLRYAINMNDAEADKQSDSLINFVRRTRSLLKEEVARTSEKLRNEIVNAQPDLRYFISLVIREKAHLLTADEDKLLSHFQYVKSSAFYDKVLSQIVFGKVKTKEGEIDVFTQMSAWQNNPDEKIRKDSEIALFNGFASQRESFASNYIALVKGLNAFSKAKHFNSLIEEKLFDYQLPNETLDNIFSEIIKGSRDRKQYPHLPADSASSTLRFTITEATDIIRKTVTPLGKAYSTEISSLLNPANGRIDIAGGGNRIPIRGTASVYPVYPSIFYAFNYEGYLIDLTLLAHEAGHAVQASLMTHNKVPLMYASGPGYFTESFGKFNELLLFDYLVAHEEEAVKKKIFEVQLQERIDGLYGAAEEAYIEYSLINAIISNKVNNASDLDSITTLAGSSVSPELYQAIPERRNLWMLLETNFRAPLHNINDMIAAALAIKYYQAYKTSGNNFMTDYLTLLKEGYHDSPSLLLKKINIDIQDPDFIKEVIHFDALPVSGQ